MSRLSAAPDRFLLSEALLEGQHEVSTLLRPERLARPIGGDVESVDAEMLRLCQVWGGAGQPLLPVYDGLMPGAYQRLLDTEQVDGVGGLRDVAVELPYRVEMTHPSDFPALLIATHETRDNWRPVVVCDLVDDDPWRLIYAAVLGALPKEPDPNLSEANFLRKGLEFDEVVPIHRIAVAGSLEDLITRASDRSSITPRQFSNMFLANGLEPDTSFLGEPKPIIPSPHAIRRAAGPNLVVAVSPGCTDDIALLWNLRAAHGDSRVLPIGIPADQITEAALRTLQEPGRATMFGLGGGGCYLVSCSLTLEELEESAAGSPSYRTVSYEDILTWGPAPGRPRSHISTWREGRTRLDPLSDADREVLQNALARPRSIGLTLDVRVQGALLPRDPTMRGSEWGGRFQAGAAQVQVSELRRQETVEVAWPSPWTCLEAVAQTRGFQVRESVPGLAAATLIRSLGGTPQIRWLAHHGLNKLLYRMAERSGMAWWKRRWGQVQRELREQDRDLTNFDELAVLLGRDDPSIAPAGEGRAVAFQEFATALGSQPAAEHWVSWAERRHLLVRGAGIECPSCRASAWVPLAAIPPPVACAGCGREILHPYGPRELRFTYRLGEPLRRVLETDSLGHVFALRWLTELFGDRALVGAHPGVEFIDPATRGVVGEIDVVLFFADGSLVPVEVKRRGAGIVDKTQRTMDSVATALAAAWDVLVFSEPARECEVFRTVERRLPERPRFLLTTDQLFTDHVLWALGTDPFGWNPRTKEDDEARDAALGNWLRENDPDQPWDPVSETLLDRSIGAMHARTESEDSGGSER